MKTSSSVISTVTTFAFYLAGIAISFALFGFRVPFISRHQGIQQANTIADFQPNINNRR